MNTINFLSDNGDFQMKQAERFRTNYFPIGNELGVKACVTPYLAGDHKLNQNAFLLEPTSSCDLHSNRSNRNFWCILETKTGTKTAWSATGNSAWHEANLFSGEADGERMQLEAGFMWQRITRENTQKGIRAELLSFVPYDKEVEILQVSLTNISECDKNLTPIAAIPLYGRSADNLRDHRHVTSMLHRIRTTEHGVYVRPTLSFDERGHQKNQLTYFVCGCDGEGNLPVSYFPTVDGFIGEAGSFLNPKAVALNEEGVPAGTIVDGREAMGAFSFERVVLKPGETKSYTILLGITEKEETIADLVTSFSSREAVEASLEATSAYWQKAVNLHFYTGNHDFDNYMRWVSFQPFLRRIYGCSFLPHHDYGKGGRGWRDLWQDCLALLLMDPKNVGQMIRDNFCGVRVDGTNATIIGAKQGEFVADRNNITRVWMDHGMWPFLTTKLYMDMTGDIELLRDELCYFKDPQVKRGTAKDDDWDADYGQWQKTTDGEIYKGTVLEHLLMQHIMAVCETGENGNILLRGADWNDAIDMAGNRGESVAFTCAYAGNLKDLADCIRKLAELNVEQVNLLTEFVELLTLLSDGKGQAVRREASEEYQKKVMHQVSGTKTAVSVAFLEKLLLKLADEITEHVRENEWITDCEGNYWFNSYYDDHGNMVEGISESGVRMMLTGQVFSVMSGVATEEQVREISRSADRYLFDDAIGGYRLNTNFHEEKYDMGRMFGFAYGEKENGAVFSHMAVMYANAMYKRGFVAEGYKALQSLANAALCTETSHIYPGVPEYFNNDGLGLYHYLTGAASWYALTMVTEVFGIHVKGENLEIEPKLMPQQFDENGKASITFRLGDRECEIVFVNNTFCSYGQYDISKVFVDEKLIIADKMRKVLINGTNFTENNIRIRVELT